MRRGPIAAVASPASAAPAPAEKANGTVTWDFNHGQVTGSVIFNANNETGGTLDYQARNGMWLHGVVTPGSYQKIDAHTAVFGGEITSGSDDYTVNHDGTDYFTVKVVDGSTSGRNGDKIAVLANMDGNGDWLTGPDATTTRDYPMSDTTAGIVSSGNLTSSDQPTPHQPPAPGLGGCVHLRPQNSARHPPTGPPEDRQGWTTLPSPSVVRRQSRLWSSNNRRVTSAHAHAACAGERRRSGQ